MDKMKQKNVQDFTCWEINCKYIGSNKVKRWLKKKFKRIARKRLREDLREYIDIDKLL